MFKGNRKTGNTNFKVTLVLQGNKINYRHYINDRSVSTPHFLCFLYTFGKHEFWSAHLSLSFWALLFHHEQVSSVVVMGGLLLTNIISVHSFVLVPQHLNFSYICGSRMGRKNEIETWHRFLYYLGLHKSLHLLHFVQEARRGQLIQKIKNDVFILLLYMLVVKNIIRMSALRRSELYTLPDDAPFDIKCPFVRSFMFT